VSVEPFAAQHVSLVDVLDRVLDRGAVIAGDITITVADVDLIRLHLQVVLGSAGTLDVSLREPRANEWHGNRTGDSRRRRP
jgi:hypothetical protein